jgi:hypothetical protein
LGRFLRFCCLAWNHIRFGTIVKLNPVFDWHQTSESFGFAKLSFLEICQYPILSNFKSLNIATLQLFTLSSIFNLFPCNSVLINMTGARDREIKSHNLIKVELRYFLTADDHSLRIVSSARRRKRFYTWVDDSN